MKASFSSSLPTRLAPGLLVFLVLAWLAWRLAEAFWLLYQGPQTPELLPEQSVISQSAPRSGGLDSARVAQWQLFGAPEAAEAMTPTDAPETRLSLELIGVFQTDDTALAGAIIAEKGRDGTLYRVGDRVPGNVTLAEIYPDRVILERLGQREALILKEDGLKDSANSVRPTSPAVARNRVERTQNAGVSPSSPATDQQRQMAITQMNLSPADGGGYRIGESAPAAVLEQVGLQTGDIILSVNGYTLGDEQSDRSAIEDYQANQAATVVVKRGDQTFTVSYPP